MFGRRSVLVAATVVALAGVALWVVRPDETVSAGRFRVVRRLDRPSGVSPFDPGARAVTARLRWTASEIEQQWTRLGGGSGLTYRSPAFDTSRSLFGIVATLPDLRDQSAVILWSGGPTLTPEDFARNRRELHDPAGGQNLLLRADNLQPDNQPIQYLFIHLPEGLALPSAVETLSVLERSDLTSHGPVGPVRLTEGGQVRDVVLAPSGHRLSYELDELSLAALSFGLHLERDVSVQVRAWQHTSEGETEIFTERVDDAGWHDFNVPLVQAGRSAITLQAVTDLETGPLSWSTPLLVASDGNAEQPNVILYVVDALRADALGLHGAGGARSPIIDRLGRNGLVYSRAYAAASWTKPSVATLLTSLYPSTHRLGARFYSDPLPRTVLTLQDALAANGYLTAQFSSNPFTGTLSNLDKGFDVAVTPGVFLDRASSNGTASIGAAQVHDRALSWLERHKGMRVFAYIHSVDTHPPFSVKGATARAAYDGSLASIDSEIGRFRERLLPLGFGDNTLFVLTADHGEAFGEHGHEGHGQSVYDEEVRVPLLFHWPGHIAPMEIDEPVHHVDLAPTILTLAGVGDAAGQFQGRSLWPHGPHWQPSPVVVTRFVYPEDVDRPAADRIEALALVDYPWKLLSFAGPGVPRRAELYRLDTDPGERNDVAGSDLARVQTLQTALDRFMADQAQQRGRFDAAHARSSRRPSAPPSRDLLDQLRSLGYVR